MSEQHQELLDGLRASILGVDKTMVNLLASRLRLVKALKRVKMALGMPAYDPTRELQVLNLLVEEARKQQVPEELIQLIYKNVARYSRCLQAYCPVKVRIAIYGYGGMGRMLASYLSLAGCWVAVTGRSEGKAREAAEEAGAEYMSVDEALDWADMLIYAVPTEAVPQLLREHRSRLRESMLVADLSSVKTPVVRAARELLGDSGPEYASLHPLFGPEPCPAGEIVAVVPVKLEAWRDKLERLLNALGLEVVYVDADRHDRVMAVNQVLHHLLLDALWEARRLMRDELGLTEADLKMLTTRSLRETMSTLMRLREMHRVVEEIRRLNPYSRVAFEAARRALEELTGGGSE